MSGSEFTTFFGWASIINLGFLAFATIMLVGFKSLILNIHSKILDTPKDELPRLYFNYLASYKVLTLILMVSPYLALKIMGH